jgi:hypothetical protein
MMTVSSQLFHVMSQFFTRVNDLDTGTKLDEPWRDRGDEPRSIFMQNCVSAQRSALKQQWRLS